MILIVDDSPTEVHLMKTALERHGFQTESAADGAEAILKAKSMKPDLIFMDVVMPGVNGCQATRKLSADPETLSIPLKDSALYAPCKISGSQHFTLNVAVWDGRAVGMDIKTQPNNPALEACLRQQVSQIRWKDRAKGINQVEYAY